LFSNKNVVDLFELLVEFNSALECRRLSVHQAVQKLQSNIQKQWYDDMNFFVAYSSISFQLWSNSRILGIGDTRRNGEVLFDVRLWRNVRGAVQNSHAARIGSVHGPRGQ
jgi:hypothetical protein